jgi:predicted RNase H-like nuclease (RuvC/YqgF family)
VDLVLMARPRPAYDELDVDSWPESHMTTTTPGSITAAIVICCVLTAVQTGCVVGSTHEQAQQKAYAQHQEDQRQIVELGVANRRLKGRIEELESSLQSAHEQLARIEQERKDIRDEVLRLKIDKEQQPGRRQDRLRGDRSPADMGDENARLRDRLGDTKRRVKELFQQLQQMLEQF